MNACFVAGTPIMTPDGSRPIESLCQHELVYAADENDPSAPVEAKRVSLTHQRLSAVIAVEIGGQTLRLTEEHPVYVQERGWTAAWQLQPGDTTRGHDGQSATVGRIDAQKEVVAVYNVTVEDHHTFFVGGEEWGFSVWVHNQYKKEDVPSKQQTGGPPDPPTLAGTSIADAKDEAERERNYQPPSYSWYEFGLPEDVRKRQTNGVWFYIDKNAQAYWRTEFNRLGLKEGTDYQFNFTDQQYGAVWVSPVFRSILDRYFQNNYEKRIGDKVRSTLFNEFDDSSDDERIVLSPNGILWRAFEIDSGLSNRSSLRSFARQKSRDFEKMILDAYPDPHPGGSVDLNPANLSGSALREYYARQESYRLSRISNGIRERFKDMSEQKLSELIDATKKLQDQSRSNAIDAEIEEAERKRVLEAIDQMQEIVLALAMVGGNRGMGASQVRSRPQVEGEFRNKRGPIYDEYKEQLKRIEELKEFRRDQEATRLLKLQKDYLLKNRPLPALNPEQTKDGPSCFVAGTPLLTPSGAVAIELLQIGDVVLSRSEHDPDCPVEARPVVQVFVRFSEVLDLHIGGQVIRTTLEHPFYVAGRGWLPAGQLAEGDLLVSHDRVLLPVEGVVQTGEMEKVYNVEVEEHHTYFVGCIEWGFSVWAHNNKVCIRALTVEERELFKNRGWTHKAEYTVNGKKIEAYHISEAEAKNWIVQQRNRVALDDSALSQATPVKKGVPDRLKPDPTVPEEVQAWAEATGYDAGVPGASHTKIIGPGTEKVLDDAIYAAGTYEKWVFVKEINGIRIEIHYIKNVETGAIGHPKITNSQRIK